MPGVDGFEVRDAFSGAASIHLSSSTPAPAISIRCVQAVRLGAYGFVDKAEPIERVVRRSRTPCRAGGW